MLIRWRGPTASWAHLRHAAGGGSGQSPSSTVAVHTSATTRSPIPNVWCARRCTLWGFPLRMWRDLFGITAGVGFKCPAPLPLRFWCHHRLPLNRNCYPPNRQQDVTTHTAARTTLARVSQVMNAAGANAGLLHRICCAGSFSVCRTDPSEAPYPPAPSLNRWGHSPTIVPGHTRGQIYLFGVVSLLSIWIRPVTVPLCILLYSRHWIHTAVRYTILLHSNRFGHALSADIIHIS